MAKKVLLALVVIFLVFYLITAPVSAAGGVRTVLDGVGQAFDSIVTFFRTLSG